MLFTAGDHEPSILLVESPGRLKASPIQIGRMGSKIGVVDGFTERLSVIIESHPFRSEGIVVF